MIISDVGIVLYWYGYYTVLVLVLYCVAVGTVVKVEVKLGYIILRSKA